MHLKTDQKSFFAIKIIISICLSSLKKFRENLKIDLTYSTYMIIVN